MVLWDLTKAELVLMKGCPPYAHWASVFHFTGTIWLMCMQETSKEQPKKDMDFERSFYAFDVQRKSARTHLRLVMTGGGQILE